MRILTVIGTRPEAIKMAPVIRALSEEPSVTLGVCTTGQHREMLAQVTDLFEIRPDFELNVMRDKQTLTHITARVLEGAEGVIKQFEPDWVLVQGDTSTVLAAALAAFYQKVRLGHVEAGLRTGNVLSPWPEEINRKLASQIASLHFAPTGTSRANLLREGIADGQIVVTGNTVIDALLWVRDRLATRPEMSARIEAQFTFLSSDKRLILVTGHRRENFDGGLDRVCMALRKLASRGDVEIIYAVHLNPVVQEAANRHLKGINNVFLIPPQDYLPFVWLMNRSYLIITDSGGVQEEAPSLGKPVLVTRDTTERPEAVDAGTVLLVGTSTSAIVDSATRLLEDREARERMSLAHNPYGDGLAAGRIVRSLLTEQPAAAA